MAATAAAAVTQSLQHSHTSLVLLPDRQMPYGKIGRAGHLPLLVKLPHHSQHI